VTKKPVRKPKVKTYEDEEKKWFIHNRALLWKRIDEAKRQPTRTATRKISVDEIPVVSIGENHYRLQARKQDFEETLFLMRLAFRDVLTNDKKLSAEQRKHLSHMRDVFQENIWRLQEYFFHNEADIDLIEDMIAAAYELGTFCGRHPIKEKVHTARASRGKRHIKRQQRLAIVKPLVLAAMKGNKPKSKKEFSIATYILADVQKQLKEEDKVDIDAVYRDVRDIKAGRV
jgi:hypothetical protein